MWEGEGGNGGACSVGLDHEQCCVFVNYCKLCHTVCMEPLGMSEKNAIVGTELREVTLLTLLTKCG
jgi:hypothetical protein